MKTQIPYNSLEKNWMENVIKEDEIIKYMENGKDFINEHKIWEKIEKNKDPEPGRIRDIMRKSLAVETLMPDETAALLNVDDEDL